MAIRSVSSPLLMAAGLLLALAYPGASPVHAGEIYTYTDAKGNMFFVDDLRLVPPAYRKQVEGQPDKATRGAGYSVVGPTREEGPAPAPAGQGSGPEEVDPADESRAQAPQPPPSSQASTPRREEGAGPARQGPRQKNENAPVDPARLSTRRDQLMERINLMEEGYIDEGVKAPDQANLDRVLENAYRQLDRLDSDIARSKNDSSQTQPSGGGFSNDQEED